MAFTAVRIKNSQRFDKIMLVKLADSPQRFLLIPECLYPRDKYNNNEWFSDESLEFYSLGNYFLIFDLEAVAGVTTGVNYSESAHESIKIARNVLFPLTIHFNKVLTPHSSEDINDFFDKTILSKGIRIDEKLVNDSIENSILKFELSKNRHSEIHPIFAALQQNKVQGRKINIERLIEIINQYIISECNKHNNIVLGGIVEHFTDELDEEVSTLVGGTFNLQDITDKVKAVLDNNLSFYELIAEYLIVKNEKHYTNMLKEKKYFRQHHDVSGNPPARKIRKIELGDLEDELVSKESVLETTAKFFDARTTSRYRDNIQNMIFYNLNSLETQKIFSELKKENTYVFDEIVISQKKHNDLLLTYYFEAQSSERPSGGYLKLFNIIEAFMVDVGTKKAIDSKKKVAKKKVRGRVGEKEMLTRILKSKFKISDLKDEIEIINNTDLSRYYSNKIKLNWDSISERIYNIRCAVVHSKSKGHKIQPYSLEEFTVIPPHLPLLDKICIRIIDETKNINLFGV